MFRKLSMLSACDQHVKGRHEQTGGRRSARAARISVAVLLLL